LIDVVEWGENLNELGTGLADQPLSEIGLTKSDEISQTEFETLWAESFLK